VDSGRVTAGSCQYEAPQEENQNNPQQLRKKNDRQGGFAFLTFLLVLIEV